VRGFEQAGGELGGASRHRHYPGAARTADELRADAGKALSLIPGRHRFNLHAIYGESGGRPVDRDEIRPEHFARWIDWRSRWASGWTSTPPVSLTEGGRQRHALAPRRRNPVVLDPPRRREPEDRRGDGPGARDPCVTNLWIPTG